MNKKSALVTAGGLTASFVAGIAAVSFDWGLLGTGAAAAAPTTVSPAPLKPRIKHRTIVVHKKAPPPKASTAPGARTITVPQIATVTPPAPVTHTSGSPTGGGDDGGDSHESGDD